MGQVGRHGPQNTSEGEAGPISSTGAPPLGPTFPRRLRPETAVMAATGAKASGRRGPRGLDLGLLPLLRAPRAPVPVVEAMAAVKELRPKTVHPVLKAIPAKAAVPAEVVATPVRVGRPLLVAMGRRPSFVRPAIAVGGSATVLGDAAVMETPRVMATPSGGARTATVARAVAPIRAEGVALAVRLAAGLPAGSARVAPAVPKPSEGTGVPPVAGAPAAFTDPVRR